jgi:hypothetical protein
MAISIRITAILASRWYATIISAALLVLACEARRAQDVGVDAQFQGNAFAISCHANVLAGCRGRAGREKYYAIRTPRAAGWRTRDCRHLAFIRYGARLRAADIHDLVPGNPNPQSSAFTAANAEPLLDKAPRKFVHHPRGATVTGRKLVVSSIYL